jgi:hypothetical protein
MTLPILNLLDLITTLYAISLGAVECNPFAAAIIAVHPALYALYKIAITPLCFWLRGRDSYKWLCAVYGVTVINNVLTILLLR